MLEVLIDKAIELAETKRPTETLTGLALAGAILAFLVNAGVPVAIAAIAAVVIAFLPATVSQVVDALRRGGPADGAGRQ